MIGDVVIGDESSVWMNAVVRGDVNTIRIGRRTNIQDGTIVHVMREPSHPTVVGDEVTVGHGVILHGCTVADRCLIGMGAILLNGSSVGADCIVAARDAADRRRGRAAALARDGQPRQGPPRADRRRGRVHQGLCRELRRLPIGLLVVTHARSRDARLSSRRVRRRAFVIGVIADVYQRTASSRSRRRRSRTSRRCSASTARKAIG